MSTTGYIITSWVVTFGAVAGPNSVEATGRLAEALGIPALAGPFLLAAVAFGLAGLVLFAFLRPDPLLVAQALDEHHAPGPAPATADQSETRTSDRRVLVGATVMVLAQIAMVAIMTMTPVHMRHHGHSLGQVGFVIGIHIGAMFLPSLVTGVLVDRLGRITMAAASGATLLAAGVLAAIAPADSMPLLTLALALLGLGWNFGVISGTALLIDGTPLHSRARTQGTVDVLIALAGAGGGAMSGWFVASTSYAVLSLAGGLLALLLIPTLLVVRGRPLARAS